MIGTSGTRDRSRRTEQPCPCGDVHSPEIRVYRSASELDEVREFWLANQRHPNTDFEHFLLVCLLRGEVAGPWVVAVRHDGRYRALVVGRLERRIVPLQVGYLRLPGVRATALTILHSGVIGQLDEEAAGAVATEIERFLLDGDVDLATVNLLPESDPLWSALTRSSQGLVGKTRPRWSTHRELALPSEPGFLLRDMRSKHRAWIRRKEKDLNAASAGGVRWSWQSPTATAIPEVCERLEAIAKTTYQRGLGVGFVDNDETRRRLTLFASRRQLRVMLLEIEGRPKAFWFGEVYCGVFHSAATGYTPDVREFEVGTLMFLRMADELVREGVHRLDFGLGDAQYKERFADRSWREGTIHMFAPTLKGRSLRAAVAGCDYFNRGVREVMERFDLVEPVKTRWRRRLAGKISPR